VIESTSQLGLRYVPRTGKKKGGLSAALLNFLACPEERRY
jgi:hypothetical protein